MADENPELQPPETDAEMAERLRPIVNEILELFNEREISPSDAGFVILSLTYRLLEVLKEAPEARRHFVGTLINLINNFLSEEFQTEMAPIQEFSVQEEF